MHHRSSHHRTLASGARPSDVVAQPTSMHASCRGITSGDHTSPLRQIAVPASGSFPSFDNVYALAITSALLDQAVLVICMTEERMSSWQHRLQERTRPVDGLVLLDGRFAWSTGWRALHRRGSYDVAVLDGIHSSLRHESLPLFYATRLADTVPAGLIVLA